MTEIQDANERFNTLWEEVGAKRIVVGDEEKGVEIVIDEDLSIFRMLDKLKEKSEENHKNGKLSSDDVHAVKETTDAIKKVFDGGVYDRLDDNFRKLIHK